MKNKQKPELIELLINGEIEMISQLEAGSYVVVADRSKPKGFAEHFALLLSDIPNIHSPNKPEFFLHVFLGSVLTLPSTGLMKKLHVQDIFFRVTEESLKLVFKIGNQDDYKLKFFMISVGESALRFTKEELSSIKAQISDVQTFSDAAPKIEGYILRISQDGGFKLQVLSDDTCKGFTALDTSVGSAIKVWKNKFVKVEKNVDQQDVLSPLVDKLSSSNVKNVHEGFEDILRKVKHLYKAEKELLSFASEAAYHGFIYGFFALNYKYANSLDCYVEKIAGVGYADLVLLSRKDNTNPFLIVLEIKDGTGRDASPEDAISQIRDRGYIYHLPSVRTEATKAIIVGANWGIPVPKKEGDTRDLKVETVDVHKVQESLVARLISDINDSQSTEVVRDNIEKQIEHLYYNLAMKHKDPKYLSRVLVGQSISLQNQDRDSFLFEYSGTITGGTVTTLFYKNGVRDIALNILEVQETSQQLKLHIDESSRTRFTVKANTCDWCMIPVQSFGIADFMAVQIVINTKASSFDKKTGKEKGYIESINIAKLKIDSLTTTYNGRFLPLDKFAVGDVIYSMFDHHVTAAYMDLPPVKKMKLGIVEEHKKIDVNDLFKQRFIVLGTLISHESDVQAILHGCFIGQQYEGKNLRVFSEASYGSGRADLVVFIKDEQNLRQEKVMLCEIKKLETGSVAAYKNAFLDSKIQLVQYIKHLKSSTHSKEVSAISVIYNSADKKIHFQQFHSKIDHTSHSSDEKQTQLEETRDYKQEGLVTVVDFKLLPIISKTGILDFSSYRFTTIDYSILKNFLIYQYPKLDLKIPLQLNLSNKQNIVDDIDLVAQMLKYDVWINDLKLSHCNLQNNGLAKLADALIGKENLKILEEGSDVEKRAILQNKKNIKGFYLKSLDLSVNPLTADGALLLSTALSVMSGLNRVTLSHMDGVGIKHITNGLMHSNALVSLGLSNLKGGLDAHGTQALVELFAKHPMLEELDLSHNHMGQSGIDQILQASKNLNIKKLDLSNNCASTDKVINVKSLREFISHNSNLESLKFAYNAIHDVGLSILQDALIGHKSLKILNLSGNNIIIIDSLLQINNHLTDLILKDNKITKLSPNLLYKPGLRVLDISYNPLNEKDMVAFFMQSVLNADTVLNKLDLSGIDFSSFQGRTKIINDLASWIKLGSSLTSLLLSNCHIDDQLARILFDALTTRGTLKSLDLSNNDIEIKLGTTILGLSSKPASLTGFIFSNSVLEELNLANNRIGDVGGNILLRAFQERNTITVAQNLPQLSVDLSRNPLTNQFAKNCADLLSLFKVFKSLKLTGCEFDYKSKNQLINALGNGGNIDITSLEIDDLSSGEQVRLDHYLMRNAYGASSTLELKLNKNFQFEVSHCLNSGRVKRSITDCKISWHDVDEISGTKTREKADIIIDAEKFLKYSKQHVDDIEKSKQLASLASEIKDEDSGRIVGKHKNILEQVIKEGSYKQYIEHKRLNYLGHQVLIDNNIAPKWKAMFVNGIGRIQMGYGMYGTFVSCKQAEYDHDSDHSVDCILNTAEIGYSFLSQPIANKISTKIGSNILMQKMLGASLAKNVAGITTRGVIEIGSGLFDIVEIIRSSIELRKCNERTDSANPCSEKEIRDAIASISISGISCISGITLLAFGAGTIVTVVVGAVTLVIQVLYNAISNVMEYSKRYNTTASEDISIFWSTISFKGIPKDLEHLAARHDTINYLVQDAWKMLLDYPEDVVAISLGLGKEHVIHGEECVPRLLYIRGGPYPYKYCYPVAQFHVKTAFSRIDIAHRHAKITELSRVLPKDIENATMVCLPKVTCEEYEKGFSQSRSETFFKCENAAVILHKQRAAMQLTDAPSSKIIIHYLKHIDSGTVISNLEWNNYFSIFGGNASLFSNSVPYNVFQLFETGYSGNIYLSANSSNILYLNNSSFDFVKVQYNHTIPLSMHMTVRINHGGIVHLHARHEGTKIQYVSSDAIVDSIVCTVEVWQHVQPLQNLSNADIVIDSGGAANSWIQYSYDDIKNCKTVFMSPNTVIEGEGKGYVVYVKPPNYTTGQFYSYIATSDGANIVFQMSFFEDIGEIAYSALDNTLLINIPLPESGLYTIRLSGYMNSNNATDYVLIDKHNLNIVPLIDTSNAVVKNFLIRIDVQEIFSIASAISYYRNISYTHKDYNISSELSYKKGMVCIWCSINDDLIIENDNVVLMSGGKGRDVYIINDNKKDALYIHNYSDDLELDFITIPSIQNSTIGIHALDVELHFATKRIILCDYLLDRQYQHIVIIDHEYHATIPFYEGSSGRISQQPFYYASPTRNIYVLSHNIVFGIICIDSEDIAFYRQESNLLITDKRKPFGILNIILKDYYIQLDKWKQVKLYSYDDGAVGNVIQLSDIVLLKTDIIISHIYDSTVHEYIVDLNERGKEIEHNNELGVGIILFQNTLLDNLLVTSYEGHLLFNSSVSSHLLVLKNWYKQDHHMLACEFNNGLEAKMIRLSDGFEKRINFNYKLSNKIADMGFELLTSTLDDIMLICTKLSTKDQEYRYNFLEDERRSVQYTTQDEIQFSDNKDANSGRILMLLLAKHYNKLFLEYPNIDANTLHTIDDSCFTVLVSANIINDIVKYLNSSSGYEDQVLELCNNKGMDMQLIMQTFTSNLRSHHKHRHHHGEDVFNHQRTRNNINEYEKKDEDIEQYHTDGMKSGYILESVFGLESSNLTLDV